MVADSTLGAEVLLLCHAILLWCWLVCLSQFKTSGESFYRISGAKNTFCLTNQSREQIEQLDVIGWDVMPHGCC